MYRYILGYTLWCIRTCLLIYEMPSCNFHCKNAIWKARKGCHGVTIVL